MCSVMVGFGEAVVSCVVRSRLGMFGCGRLFHSFRRGFMTTKTKAKPVAPPPKKVLAVYRSGYSSPVDATSAYAELERIRKLHGGVLEASDAVKASRNPKSVLHPVFEWNDRVAADLHREDQARQLIRNVCVTMTGEMDRGAAEPVYIHVTAAVGPDVPGYCPIAMVMSDADLRARAVADAMAQLEGWERRHAWLSELGAVFEALEAAKAKVKTKKQKQ